MNNRQVHKFRKDLLGWYDSHRRVLPWRALPGVKPDPYHVWLSEIMLQQTTVNAVIPYFLKFTAFWPDIHSLAKAAPEDVMKEWAGLGYYTRARNLVMCAAIVSEKLQGVFPSTPEELRKLPGIGEYTSAAIAAIAFNDPATVVDANVERIIARYYALEEPLQQIKRILKEAACPLFEGYTERPGDLAQALMDLGATVCVPRAPRCSACPLSAGCLARKKGLAASIPARAQRRDKPKKYGAVYWISNGRGQILVHRREEKGMLGGMLGLPTSSWLEKGQKILHPTFLQKYKPLSDGRKLPRIYHSFTHFDLELEVLKLSGKGLQLRGKQYFWAEENKLETLGFPSLFKKVIRIA